MCDFCLLFDFSSARARVRNGVASIEKAPEGIPFLQKQQFKFCPMCGSPVDAESLVLTDRFPTNLRRIRRMNGITQEVLGREMGVQKSAVSKWEHKRATPDIYQLVRLCKLLDVTPQELL